MTQDRSTPLESVVDEARKHASLMGCSLCKGYVLRLADRVKAQDEALTAIAGDDEGRYYVSAGRDQHQDIARQALSTQPHQDSNRRET